MCADIIGSGSVDEASTSVTVLAFDLRSNDPIFIDADFSMIGAFPDLIVFTARAVSACEREGDSHAGSEGDDTATFHFRPFLTRRLTTS